jgi:ABC-type nitrate/sulfonate/bicarbonate transport system substrate-binding protein
MSLSQHSNDPGQSIRIAAPAEPAFAPLWLASDLGFFAEEHVDVQWVANPPGVSALDLLSAGDVDVIVGSLWFTLARPELGLVCIGQINARCHHLLVARREGHRNSKVEAVDLIRADSTILVPGHAPTPTVALLAAFQKANFPRPRLIPLPNSVVVEEEFAAGSGDLAVLPLDRALALGAQMVLNIPSRLGPVPWSVLFANVGTVASHAESLERVLRATGKTSRWIQNADVEELREAARGRAWLTESAPALLVYAELGLWNGAPQIDRDAAKAWNDTMVSLHLARAVPKQTDAAMYRA